MESTWPIDGGSMGALVRAHDWSTTPLGPIGDWPQSLRTVVDLMLVSPGPVYVAWGPGLVSLYNDSYIPLLDTRHPGSLGKPFAEVWPEIWEEHRPVVDATMAGQPQCFGDRSIPLMGQVGPMSWFTFSWTPLRDETGAISGFYCAAVETTGKVRAEEDLRESEARLAAIFARAEVGLSELALDGRFLQVNDELCRILGRPRDEMLRLSVAEVTHPEDIGPSLAVVDRVIRTGESASLDKRYQRPDGRPVWANSRITLLDIGNGHGGRLLAVTVDLTARNEAEQAMRESEARFRTLAETMPQLVWICADEGVCLWVSPRWAEFSGRPAEAMLGQGWLEIVHPDDRDRARQAWRHALAEENLVAELRLRRADGAWRWFLVRDMPVPPLRGRRREWCGAFSDVTELKEVQDALRAARDKADMANLGKTRFLASVSHDLRQPVMAANLFLSVLRKRPLGPAERELVEPLADSLSSLSGMLNNLLEVARLDAGILQPKIQDFLLDELLQRLYGEFQGIAREARLRLHVPPTHWAVRSDPLLVELVLRNLISNALKYTETGGLSVETRVKGGSVVIEVSDTGRGIPPDELDRIFEDYFQIGNTARDHSRGFGIGLATVRRVATLLGTEVRVRSEVGQGSTFTLALPLAEDWASAEEDEAVGSGPILEGRTALVVDDEPLVLKALELMLETLGIHVHTARTLAQAEAVLDGLDPSPDIVIADYSLAGGERGTEAIALAQRRGTPISLLVTGDTSAARLAEAQRSGTRLLHKPVAPGALEDLLAQAVAAL